MYDMIDNVLCVKKRRIWKEKEIGCLCFTVSLTVHIPVNISMKILILLILLQCLTGCGREDVRAQKEAGVQETDIMKETISFEKEIPVDFPFQGEARLYSLVLAEAAGGEYELRLYDEAGEILQQISCGILAEPIQFSYDALCGWSDLEIFPADSSTGLFFGWDGQRFSENAIEIPKYTEIRENAMLTTEEENTYQIKKIYQINEEQKCVEEVCRWQLQKATGALEIWNYLDHQSLFEGVVPFNEDGSLVNQEYYDMLFWDSLYLRRDCPEETTVKTWIAEPRTESTEESEKIESFEYIQKEVFGNEGHTGEYESRDALLADFGFKDSAPMYQYYDRYHNLQLELYMDEASEQFYGIVYKYYMNGKGEKWAQMYGYTINTVQKREWAGEDAFSMKTVYGDADYVKDYEEIIEYTPVGLPDYFCYQGVMERETEPGELSKVLCTVVEINYIYRDDGTLFCRDYWHDSYVFGSTLCNLNSFYDENGRVTYENGYITHGELEYYYIYGDEGEKPLYCLALDHNAGYVIPDMIRYQ